jgi:hypothetical protein
MNLPLAPLAALVLGTAAATALAVLPGSTLEDLVMGSGIPAIVSAAAPPLGMTARLVVAGGAGAAVGLVTWFALFLLFGTRGLTVARESATVREVPVVRRADAHPDAPPRPPLLATRDLGTPFLEVTAKAEAAELPAPEPLFTARHVAAPVEQPLPMDLEQPLSAFDPDAIRDVPMPPPVALPPLRHAPRPAVFDATERFETFELTPIRRTPAPRPIPAPRPREEGIARPETEATVHALLERLERGVVRRGLGNGAEMPPTARETERGLEDALVTLRNLARRA